MRTQQMMEHMSSPPPTPRRPARGRSSRRGFSYAAVLWLLCCTGGGIWMLSQALAGSPAPSAPARRVTKNIEDVKVGDYVLAKNPDDSGPARPHPVVAIPRNFTRHLIHIAVQGGGEIQATRSHPFWVRERGWTNAKAVRVGDSLIDECGTQIRVCGVSEEERSVNTYNLTVEDVHTYYAVAGTTAILVHNANEAIPPIIYRLGKANPGNFKARPQDDGGVSYRDSLSNPWPTPEGQGPVFPAGKDDYVEVDTSKLPPGSVIPDNDPPGHVTVQSVAPEDQKAAAAAKKFSKFHQEECP